jgi:S1-C subfamily serine protease
MRLFFRLIIIVAVLASLIYFSLPHKTVPEQIRDRSVEILSYGSMGSGVIITRGDRNYVWTDAHVVAGCRVESKIVFLGEIYVYVYFRPVVVRSFIINNGIIVGRHDSEAEVIRYSDSNHEDLALLEIKENTVWNMTHMHHKIGTDVYHYGFMRGLSGCFSSGVVSQPSIISKGIVFDRTSLITLYGGSGGGMYTKDGECIGMLDGIYVSYGVESGINNIIPARRIVAYAKRVGVMWAINPYLKMPANIHSTTIEETNTFRRYRDWSFFVGDLETE